MSHTSQRRGLKPGEEMIVLAMVPGKYRDEPGMESAMAELALKMIEHKPHNWLSKNFVELRVPQIGAAQGLISWLHKRNPELAWHLLMREVGRRSSVITALYTDQRQVEELLQELKGPWLERNKEKGLPISIVLSGLFEDINQCCRKTGLRQHTYLHSLGFFGKTSQLPSEGELELITMCGHGLISVNLVHKLVEEIKQGKITPPEAAHEISKPCVCGIVNSERAARVFQRLVKMID